MAKVEIDLELVKPIIRKMPNNFKLFCGPKVYTKDELLDILDDKRHTMSKMIAEAITKLAADMLIKGS